MQSAVADQRGLRCQALPSLERYYGANTTSVLSRQLLAKKSAARRGRQDLGKRTYHLARIRRVRICGNAGSPHSHNPLKKRDEIRASIRMYEAKIAQARSDLAHLPARSLSSYGTALTTSDLAAEAGALLRWAVRVSTILS